jgi:hypothetical protein
MRNAFFWSLKNACAKRYIPIPESKKLIRSESLNDHTSPRPIRRKIDEKRYGT